MRRIVWSILALLIVLAAGVSSMQNRTDSGGRGAAQPYRDAVTAGGLIHVSGITSPGGGALAGSDVGAETGRVLDRLQAVVEAAGSSLSQVLSVSVCLTRASDFEAMNRVYRDRFPEAAPARTTIVADLADNALVQMSAVVAPGGAPRDVLHPAGWMKSPRPYSYIVRSGDLVFFSGLLSRSGVDDRVVPGGVRAQTRTILDNAGVLLRTAGLTYRSVVVARVYLIDDSLFEDMNDEYQAYFSVEPPARATIVTGLVSPDAQVEITLVAAVVPKQTIGPNVAPSLPLSTAVRVGPLVFLSGVVGNTQANAQDLAGQTREVQARLTRTLALAGLTPADVVDSTVYTPDLWKRREIDRLNAEFFPAPGPARTMFGARMASRASLIEMVLTAAAR